MASPTPPSPSPTSSTPPPHSSWGQICVEYAVGPELRRTRHLVALSSDSRCGDALWLRLRRLRRRGFDGFGGDSSSPITWRWHGGFVGLGLISNGLRGDSANFGMTPTNLEAASIKLGLVPTYLGVESTKFGVSSTNLGRRRLLRQLVQLGRLGPTSAPAWLASAAWADSALVGVLALHRGPEAICAWA